MAVKSSRQEKFKYSERRTKLNPPLHGLFEIVPSTDQPAEAPSIPKEPVQSDEPLPPTFIDDLTQLFRLENHLARNSKHVQRQLCQAQDLATRASRLVHIARSVQRTLAECIKSEDKDSFVNLSSALNDASTSLDAVNSPGQAENIESSRSVNHGSSFLDALPLGSKSVILDFLHKVRHDGNFVADRIAALTQRELVSLLPDRSQARSDESIFGSSPRNSTRNSRQLGFVADSQSELLSSFEYGSPLETLVLSVRGNVDPSLANDHIATDVWSTVCAKLITEQRPGFEKAVPAVINLWAQSSQWPGKERFSLWISQVLQDGSFLLDQPSKQSFRVRAQGPQNGTTNDDIRSDQFYKASVTSLMALLGDQHGASMIPIGADKMCRAICQKLHGPHQHGQQAFAKFVLTRWYLSFLHGAITLPEIHGLMHDQFFTENSRKKVLREIASRMESMVFDVVYSWKHGTTCSPESIELVQNVVDRFQLPIAQGCLPVPDETAHVPKTKESDTLIRLSLADVNSMVSGLCPRRRQDSVSSVFDPFQLGLRSSASSISGFSLFQNVASIGSAYPSASPWTPELQHPTPIDRVTSPLLHAPGSVRVDSVLQSDWDPNQLWQATAALEDQTSAAPSHSSGPWCDLVARTNVLTFCTLKEAIAVAKNVDTASRTSQAHTSNDSVPDQKCRETIEELLSNRALHQSQTTGTTASGCTSVDDIVQAFRAALDRRVADLEQDSDFVTAHAWFRKRKAFTALVARENGYVSLHLMLNEIQLSKERSVSRSRKVMEACDVWTQSIKPAFELYDRELQLRFEALGRLRDKMWYVAEVRVSAAYDELRLVASALRTMGRPKQPLRTRLAPGLRQWSASKTSSNGVQMKTEAQVLELLGASSDYGGPNKLSDDQSRGLYNWLERNAVENICLGEERIHKLCMDIRKAVDQITLENSPLLSSVLFARDKSANSLQRKPKLSSPFWPLQAGLRRFDALTLQTNVPRSIDTISSASSHPLSARSSRDYLDGASPALTNRSSVSFWSPVTTEAQSPSSATSVGTSQTHAAVGLDTAKQNGLIADPKQKFIEHLRQTTTSLLLSELANMVFSAGSETDRAFWAGLGGDLSTKHLLGLHQKHSLSATQSLSDERFNFAQAFQILARRFEASHNPFTKLGYVMDMYTLLVPYMSEQEEAMPPQVEGELNTTALRKLKRQGSSHVSVKVQGFRRLLCDPTTRPNAIFRDLQYIAALVPATTLESTPQGKAFWNMTVAALSLKQEIRQYMVETADDIISYQSNNRVHGRAASIAQQERDSATFAVPSRTPSAEDIKRYTMADAAYLLQITAKEGDAAAQRELATLYLTNPELMDHIIAPLSRPRDVFREELENKWRKNQDLNRCDPVTMCVAHHWMDLSSKGGDALAKEYLRQREEMDRLG